MALELFTIQQPHEITFSGCPIIYSFACAPYTYQERQQDVRISIRVEREVSDGAGIYTEIKNQLIYPDLGGMVSIDIASIIDAYLKYSTPRINLSAHMHVVSHSSRVRITAIVQKAGVIVGDPLITDPIIVIKGGLAYESFHFRNFFTDNIFTQKKPLHYFTGSETVRPTDKKFLYWMYNRSGGDYPYIKVTFNLANGTTLSYTGSSSFVQAKEFDIICTPISLEQLKTDSGITVWPAAIASYTVEIVITTFISTITLINPITFYVDYRSWYNTTQLFYTNSVGGLDDIGILGETESQAEYESTAAQQVTAPGGISQAVLQAQNINWSSETEKFVGSTTFISKDKVNRLRDLLLSTNVYEYKNDQLVPVIINKKNVKFYSSKDSLFSLAIEWQHAFANQFYTPPGSIAADATCPDLLTFRVKQVARGTLQVMWAAPMPYDMVELVIDNGTPGDEVTLMLNSNSGSQYIDFPNLATYPSTLTVVCNARVVCNPFSDPISYGPNSTVVLTAAGNSLPVANDDIYTIQAGFTTAQVLVGSVLDNDYDPDGDAIEVDATSGGTTAGGSFSIDAAGIITYTPPSALYNGTDTFYYACKDVINPSLADTAQVRIQVGNITLGSSTYVKLIERNQQNIVNGPLTETFGDFFLTFWADPAATIAKIPSPAIAVNVRNIREKTFGMVINWVIDTNTLDVHTSIASNEKLVFSGQYYFMRVYSAPGSVTYKGGRRYFAVEPGTGYIPI